MFVPLKIRYLLNFYVSRENIKFETFVLPFYVYDLILLDKKNDFMKKKNIFTLYIYFVCEDNLILFIIVYFTIKF